MTGLVARPQGLSSRVGAPGPGRRSLVGPAAGVERDEQHVGRLVNDQESLVRPLLDTEPIGVVMAATRSHVPHRGWLAAPSRQYPPTGSAMGVAYAAGSADRR